MKEYIIRALCLDGEEIELKFHEIEVIFHCHPDDVTYIKENGISWPVKSESIELIEVK